MDFIFDPSLVLYLPLCKLDGSSFMSKDAYGHTCTRYGALWRPNGRAFNGDDYIDLGDLPVSTTALTVIVWGQIPTQSSKGIISQLDVDNSQASWELWLDTDILNILLSDNGAWAAGHRKLYKYTFVGSTNWRHISFTWDAGTIRVFIESSEVTPVSKDEDDAITAIHDSTSSVLIGARPGTTPSGFLTGVIGEVQIYNQVLSPPEIQHNYLATKWRYR